MEKQKLFNLRTAARALTMAAAFPLVLTSCQDEEFGYTSEAIKYAKAYENFFGELPADKSWDLSSYSNHYRPEDNNAQTRSAASCDGELTEGADGEYQVKSDYWEVPQHTLNWMKKALVEGKDNRYLGSNFVLKLPKNSDFVIVPIFQGKSSIMSELEVKINGYEIQTVWSRSQNIQVKDAKRGKTTWTNIGYYDGYSGYDLETMRSEHGHLTMYPSYTDEADAVRAKPIYFRSKEKIGYSDNGFMYLSLHNIDKAWASWTNWEKRWDEGNEWTTIGHRLTSINPQGHMLALNIPWDARPTSAELPNICEQAGVKPSQVLMIACEDANGPGTDHDVNDVAFLIIGYPEVPTVVPTTEIIKKRYMCEDLGGTYDYDFNDIVVDVTQTQQYEIVAEPDMIEDYDPAIAGNITIKDMRKVGCPVQTAKIARLCGTIPLQVRIGDFMFPKIKDPVGHDTWSTIGDGKYSTRDGLIHGDYRNLCNGVHTCGCSDHASHSSYASGGGQSVGHHPITRGTVYPDDYEVTDGWNPNEEQIIPCHTWDPDKNNIVIYADWGYEKTMYNAGTVSDTWLQQKENNPFENGTQDFADFANGKKFAVTFPETGQYPYIIATDQDVPWMKEGKHIPENWVQGNLSGRDSETMDIIGNSFYMEKYPSEEGEGYIWSGDVTGIAYSTAVTIKPGTAEMAAIKESDEHSYYVLHVYGEAPVGETARVGLYTANDWKPLTDNDPDGYIMVGVGSDARLHKTYEGVASNMVCATVYLTRDQLNEIYGNGLVVASRTSGLRIKKITTARPCIYKSDGTIDRVPGGIVYVDPGFTININTSDMKVGGKLAGRIIASYGERLQNIIEAEEGKVLTSEQENANAAEPERASVPFLSQKFISGTEVELTAVGQVGYKLKKWYVNDVEQSQNPITLTHKATAESDGKTFNVRAEFMPAVNPELHLLDGTNKITLTLALNGSVVKPYPLKATSLNLTEILSTFDVNNQMLDVATSISGSEHVINITPKAIGETSFILFQKDGEHGGTSYGVSEEIIVTVKVIDELPDMSGKNSLASWMMYEWSGTDANAYIVSKPNDGLVVKYNQTVRGTGDDLVFGGNQWSHNNRYVDLPHADWMVAMVNSGSINFTFNRQPGADASQTYAGNGIVIDENSKDYCTVIDNGEIGKKTYIINLKKFREKYGYVHLVCVKAKWDTEANVDWIKVSNDYSEIRGEWAHAINELKPNAQTSLSINDFYNWNGYDLNATISGQNTADYINNLNNKMENGGIVLGHKWGAWRNTYADLSKATVLDITADKANTTGIWLIFNRDEADNKVEIKETDRDVCAVLNDGSNVHYVIDLVALKNKIGTNYLHLNAIHAPQGNSKSAKVTSVKVDVNLNPIATETEQLAANDDQTGWTELNYSGEYTGDHTLNCNEEGDGYGHGSVPENCYADLSDYTVLKLALKSDKSTGTARFVFNCQGTDPNKTFFDIVESGNNNEYLHVNHELESLYNVTIYYVNLKAIKEHKGAVKLNCIKALGGTIVLQETPRVKNKTL